MSLDHLYTPAGLSGTFRVYYNFARLGVGGKGILRLQRFITLGIAGHRHEAFMIKKGYSLLKFESHNKTATGLLRRG